MTKISASFLGLAIFLVLSSILYIWKSESEQKALEATISANQAEIATLKTELTNLQNTTGEVQGASATALGTLTGTVTLTDPTAEAGVVCVQETHTKQEHCTDFVVTQNKNSYEYSFEIPVGTYEVYALTLPSESKVFYSDIQVCDENINCVQDAKQKRLIQIYQFESQDNIDISL